MIGGATHATYLSAKKEAA